MRVAVARSGFVLGAINLCVWWYAGAIAAPSHAEMWFTIFLGLAVVQFVLGLAAIVLGVREIKRNRRENGSRWQGIGTVVAGLTIVLLAAGGGLGAYGLHNLGHNMRGGV